MKASIAAALIAAASLTALAAWSVSQAQTGALVPTATTGGATDYPGKRPRPYPRVVGPETLNPGAWPHAWPYPDEYDSVSAAPEVHHLRYLDAKIHFVEVAYFAGVHGQMHGHPYASVFAVDAPSPKSVNERLDPDRAPKIGHGDGPNGQPFPFCNTMGPESPHAETNLDTWPHHFYRLEYVRVDGKGIQDNWKAWYPRALDPPLLTRPVKVAANAGKLSADWPYPVDYDSVRAAPNNYRLLFEDDHVRLVEVTLRPGETEPVHGDPYPAVIAMDALTGEAPATDRLVDAASPLNGAGSHVGASPPDFDSPSCATTSPRAPHAMTNTGKVAIHYYRIEFKRIDGPALQTSWRQWYPWMANLTDQAAKSPYRPNY